MKPALHFQRFEFKYPMHKPTADKIIPALLKHMKWDPFVAKNEDKFYYVTSLYFDNSGYGCFFEKESGEKFRKKFRLRIYDNEITPETKMFVEIKRKNNALVLKDRVILPARRAREIIVDNRSVDNFREFGEGDAEVLREFLWTKNYNCLTPKLLVSYKRKPLVSKYDEEARVTFDYDIKAKTTKWFDGERGFREVLPNALILEIKYNNVLPYWLHEIIQKYGLERVAFSKYCNSLRRCVPSLDDGSGADIKNYLGL